MYLIGSIESIFYTITIIIILLILGEFVNLIFKIILKNNEDCGFFTNFPQALYLGSSFIVILYYTLFYLSIKLSSLLIKTIFVISFLILTFIIILKYKEVYLFFRKIRTYINFDNLILFIFLIINFILRFFPYKDKYVYSGYDIKLYSIVATRINEEGLITLSWGLYDNNWSIAADSHLIFSGASMIAVFLSNILDIKIPQIYSLQTLTFNSLIPIAIYFLIKGVFKKKGLAFLTMFIFSILSPYPYFFIQWGGIGETIGWYFLANMILLSFNFIENGRKMNLFSIFIGLLALPLVHPLVYVYYFIFLILLLTVNFKSNRKKYALYLLILLLLSFILLLPYLLKGYIELKKIENEIKPGTLGWSGFEETIVNLNDISKTIIYSLLFIFIPIFTYIIANEFKNKILIFTVWIFILVFLNINNPFSLIHVQFPFWYFFIPVRVIIFLCFPISIILSFLSYKIFIVSTSHIKIKIILIIIGLVLACELIYYNLYATIETVEWGNSLTINDLYSFEWIKKNINKEEIIMGTIADSTFWIPSYINRRVFCIPQIVNNFTIISEHKIIESKLINGSIEVKELILFLKKYNISYIFFGERVEYDLPRYKLNILLDMKIDGQKIFQILYKKGNVLILKINEKIYQLKL